MNQPRKLTVSFEWRSVALAVVLIPIMLSLGFWQLDRADEKRELQALFAKRQVSEPIALSQLLGQSGGSAAAQQDLRYQPVRLRGKYISDKTLLLDNRIYQGQFGFEVVSPFQLENVNQIVMVNRGWVPGDKSRRSLPTIETPAGEVDIRGVIHVPQGKMMTLATEQQSAWPRIQQSLDITALAGEFDPPVFPYSVRLREDAAGAFQPSWVVVNLQPEKHTAYAVQWFAMSAALVIFALLANTNLWALIARRDNQS